ncbi:hypothetical protein GCM10027074_18380 [Streptomyces deserti]
MDDAFEVPPVGADDETQLDVGVRGARDGADGLGDGAHARHEHVLLDHVPPRTALLAGCSWRARRRHGPAM